MASSLRRRFGSYALAFLIAAAAIAWVASGELMGQGDPEPQKPPAPTEPIQDVPKVRVATQTAEPHTRTLSVKGRTQAARKVTVRAETAGRIAELLVERGDDVAAGDVLARIDAQDRPARLAEAEARLEQRRIELEASSRLSEKGFRAEVQLAESRAAFEEAQAAVRRAEVALADTVIRAPFAGRVGERMIEIGDYVSEGTEIARIVDFDPIKAVAHVTERAVANLAPGMAAQVHVVGGQVIDARVVFVAGEADPDTRTFRIEVEGANPDAQTRDGVTARITAPMSEAPAHFIQPSILSLRDDGVLGVKVVNADAKVDFQPIEILDESVEGMWVTGLPETVTLITVGQDFVNVGQKVAPVPEGDISSAPGRLETSTSLGIQTDEGGSDLR